MKTIVFLLISFVVALNSQAQKQTIGFSAGVSASSIIYKKEVANPSEFRIGHIYNVNYELEIFNSIYLCTGVTFQEKGFTNVLGGDISQIKASVAHRYLTIPIGLGFKVGEQLYAKLFLRANFSALIMHESHVKLYSNGKKYEENYYYQTDQYTPFDIAFNPLLRFGYTFKNRIGLFIEGSFSVSLNYFYNEKNKAFSPAVNNYAFASCIGIDYRI